MFARIGLSVVNDLAPVNAVLQHQIERTAGKWLTTRDPARGARPQLALDAQGVQLVSQPPDRAEFGVAAKSRAVLWRACGSTSPDHTGAGDCCRNLDRVRP